MSSVSKSTTLAIEFGRAERLKDELVNFVTKGHLKAEFELQRKLFLEAAQPDDEHDAESVLDWFLFDWVDEGGDGAIGHYMESDKALEEADLEILTDWQDSINSVFEIRSSNKESLELLDLDSEDIYAVKTRSGRSPFKTGQFIIARLLPLGHDLIFSGLQFLMPDRESALAWLEMSRAFDAFDSPEAVEKARREQCSAFCDLFGCDELTVASTKLHSTLERFQRYLLTERRDPETGMTPAERFRKELGQELSVPDLPPLPKPVAGAGEVTILCDEFDGIVLLPDFNSFKRVFETDEPDRRMPDWKDLVWTYIKNPDIPIVAFERVAEQFPLRVEKVLRSLIGDKDFSLEHLYAVLLHYKQPVDGLESLKDDQHLWDLFNGNTQPADTSPGTKRSSKPRTRTKTATKKAAANKAGTKASAKLSSKKTSAIKRARSAGVPGTRRTSTAKPKTGGRPNATASRASRVAGKRSGKSTSKKR